jgi:uncharacterized protein (TIGR03437 family)
MSAQLRHLVVIAPERSKGVLLVRNDNMPPLKFRLATGAIPVFLSIGALTAPADTLPAYCGAVGAKSYTPPAVNIPAVILNRGTVITVTNAAMAINGDTSSVAALMANPGPDGISLQEALTATNNDPGTWVIQFAPALKGSTIVVDTPPSGGLQPLSGGNVTVNGDIDGDGQPDITLTSMSGSLTVYVLSGGNTLHGLALQNCGTSGCVQLRNPSASGGFGPGPVAIGKTFANTTISNLVMTNFPPQATGIQICPNCGTAVTSPTGNVWDHVLITGNTLTGSAAGPGNAINVQVSWGDTLQHTTFANNNIVLAVEGGIGISLNTGDGLGPPDQGSDILLDTLVVNNTITASLGINFRGTAVGSLYDGAQVIGNQISTTGGSGITFFAADVESGLSGTVVQHFNNNIMRNIGILANTIEGPSVGIQIQPGQNGAANNAISNVSIMGNTLLNTVTGAANGPTTGMFLYAGRSDQSAFVATGNSLSNVLIRANTIQNPAPPGNVNFGGGNPEYAIQGAGISVYGGIGAQGNSINGMSIANNEVNTPAVGIAITGGDGDETPAGATTFSADGNVVAGAQIFCNQVDQIPTLGIAPSSGIKGINVAAGEDVASGNQVQQLYIADNLVAGTLGGASTFEYLGTGGSGNVLTTSASPTPAISLVANAEGESPVIAPNTWIEIQGVNLAPNQDALISRIWQTADFVNHQLPVQLDGASVTVNGSSAYVYYVSPSQINALTAPDSITGSVNVVVTNNGISSALFVAQAQALSPSFFVFDGLHVVATHLDYTDIGPTTLYPGLTTPAQPGETIVLYANGFGPTSTPVVSGAETQSGTLSPMPVITIAGIHANVRFAGLNGTPGEFQFNVDVPTNVADGELPLTATYNGVTTQAGVVLTVQH